MSRRYTDVACSLGWLGTSILLYRKLIPFLNKKIVINGLYIQGKQRLFPIEETTERKRKEKEKKKKHIKDYHKKGPNIDLS